MAMTRFNPAREVEAMRNEMVDRVFGGFFGQVPTREITPAIRVWETADAFTVQAIVPGLERDSLDIHAAPHGLSISGKVEFKVPEGVNVRHNEYGNGEFRRMLQLSTQIRSEAVKASYADGILTVTLPKTESQRIVKVKLDDVEPSTPVEVGQSTN